MSQVPLASVEKLLRRFALTLVVESPGDAITGSFWGGAEAGLVGSRVHVRNDTPVHSLLHEACHVICMDPDRRQGLERDAGSDDLEEAAVCYLQLLLADEIEGLDRDRLMRDMDEWGYSFRLGTTRAWFERDAGDAAAWLLDYGLIDNAGMPAFRLRGGV